jgi:hypothetical protein
MLLYITNWLTQFESGFNVFSYLTLRAILGALTALVLSFVMVRDHADREPSRHPMLVHLGRSRSSAVDAGA